MEQQIIPEGISTSSRAVTKLSRLEISQLDDIVTGNGEAAGPQELVFRAKRACKSLDLQQHGEHLKKRREAKLLSDCSQLKLRHTY